MITYVLMIAKTFPKTHKRDGELTKFAYKIDQGDKIHTIRANYELWEKRFEKIKAGKAVLVLKEWEGVPYRSKQIEVDRFDINDGIGIEKLTFSNQDYWVDHILLQIKGNKHIAFSTELATINQLAYNDGLSSQDFRDWFKDYDLTKPMAIIHFTKFRYN